MKRDFVKRRNEFFWNFETSMALLDDQYIALYFGKTGKGVYEMQKTIEDALKILQKVFGEWIASISVEKKDAGSVLQNVED